MRGKGRQTQVRRYLTGRGFPGLQAEDGSVISGVPGWNIVVTLQNTERSGGVSIWSRLLDLNRTTRTVIIRARAMTTNPPPEVGDSQVLIRLEDYADLLVYRYEHEQKGCT
jgi:hypothetical protein